MIERFSGNLALTQFQQKKLLAACTDAQNNIKNIEAEYLHFVSVSKKLSAAETAKLQALLTYNTPLNANPEGELFLVVPRPGTISPWSSKATDIAKNSGLNNVLRIERGIAYYLKADAPIDRSKIGGLLHDRMTETVLSKPEAAAVLFETHDPETYQEIPLLQAGKTALEKANRQLGLALSEEEITYLSSSYTAIKRNPTDIELMMFAVVNSEHCRHKIFNAKWVIDGKKQSKSLFQMIKNTYEKNPGDVLSAYSDNAAVLKGSKAAQFYPGKNSRYSYHSEPAHLVIKAETHNHPTAISPFAGAATGIGGEIRDEGATGRGARSKMGFAGFSVSNLNIPELPQPWEASYGKPDLFSSPLDIMIEAPLGGAAFANEFGRINLSGYFRTYEQGHNGTRWGYHKPLMLAGGLGTVRDTYVHKKKVPAGAKLVVLGGPAMLIGLGGGTASSMQSGKSEADLDFASVQRGNGEMQRRAQEVINACWAMDANPIISIHDVGAGGLSNGLPELVHDNNLGAEIELRDIPNAEPGMSPLEIWCNEAQERYVLAIDGKDLSKFEALCKKERAPFAVVGHATANQQLIVKDRLFKNTPIDIPLSLLFGNPPKMIREFTTQQPESHASFSSKEIKMEEAIKRVLHMPAVGSKKFLITIGDRTVGGLSVRDQMVGPWQVPVSDVAVTAASYEGFAGEALAIGERMPLGIVDAPASARMAVGEAITNIAAASIASLSDIKLSANWMAAAGYGGEDEKLFESVKSLGEQFCPQLGICIPVGKDSLSMRAAWDEKGKKKSVTSPMSLVISAFSPVTDTARTLTPQLKVDARTHLILIDLGRGKNRMAGSALAQAYSQVGNETPDADAELLKKFFDTIQSLNQSGKLLAYHDRSDGGAITTLFEMAFASRCGLQIYPKAPSLHSLFTEELGAIIQVAEKDADDIIKLFDGCAYSIAHPTSDQKIIINDGPHTCEFERSQLESWWSATSYHVQKLRDNPVSALQEIEAIKDKTDPGLSPKVSFKLSTKKYSTRPKAAILREQGINGQVEMAAAFERAGFDAIDVHLSDLASGRHFLQEFSLAAVCGGFSYGDVLGAGEGWAKSILFNPKLRADFKSFFERPDTLTLGVCNGCQMLANLKELIPGAQHWPKFLQNESGRYEARLVSVQVNDSPSVFFKGMVGSILPIPVAHGEGRAIFAGSIKPHDVLADNLAPLQYVDNRGNATIQYPLNPNGSADGLTSLTSQDGRATILMPHPERVFLTKQLSWHPAGWDYESPWFKIFQNAREWIG